MLRKKKGLCLALMTSLFVISCQNSSSSVDGDVQYLAVQTESDGKWGMVDSKGNLLFADEFKNEPTSVVNGYFSVREGSHYTLYSASSKPSVVPGCDELVSVGVFKDGIIPVTHEKSRITLVDGKGNVKATLNPINGKEVTGCTYHASEGLFAVTTEDGKCGYVDLKGNVVIDPKYDNVGLFSEGLAIVSTEKNNEPVFLVIDKKGQEVFRLKKDLTLEKGEFSEGLLVARNADDQFGFLNKKGEFNKVKGKVKRIGDYNSSLFAFMDDEYQWGVMSMDGETLIRPKYGSMTLLSDGTFFVSDGEKYYIMDKKGDKLQTLEDYSYVTPLNLSNFFFLAQDKSTYVLLDKNGKPIGKEEFKGINYTPYTSAMVTSDYFNFDSVSQALVGSLTANGIDKYTLNMPVSKLGITNYNPYVYEYEYKNPELNQKGWRYRVETGVRTDLYIAKRDYSTYDSKVVMNPEAKVEQIFVIVRTEVPCWKELKEKLISEIKTKGYKLDEQSEREASFTSNDCKLDLSSSYDGETISIRLTPNSKSSVSNNSFSSAAAAAEEAYVAEADTVAPVAAMVAPAN